MSSEAAQKAYPNNDRKLSFVNLERQAAFDKGAQWGAAEALRQAADTADRNAGYISVEQLTNMIEEWEVGQ